MSDQTTPETSDDDDFPPVRFALRNTSGTSNTIAVRSHVLGLDRYILIRTGDDAFEVEASHLSMDDFSVALAVVLASALQSGHVTADIDAMVRDLIADED